MDFRNYKKYFSHGSGKFKKQDFKFFGRSIVIESGVLIFHPENINFGNNIYIGHGSVIKGYYKNEILIGDHSWIGSGCFLHGAGNIKIGKAVGIGPMVKIITSSHKSDDLSIPVLFHDLEFKEVIIGDGSDIGVGSIILPGVIIGKGAIIGAGSVVNKNVPDFYIAAGVPARIIKKRQVPENEI